MNKKILFNDGWEFAKSSLDVVDCSNLKFESIDIPHDWLIYNVSDLYENSIGWYKKKLILDNELKDKKILLWFDGVYMNSSLYVNGQYIGDWKYGYSSFEHDITEALKEGENEIILKVIHENPNSRWYSGAGIYRNVYLKIREKNYIDTNGIYVVTKKHKDDFCVNVNTRIIMINNGVLKHKITRNDEVIAEASEVIKVESYVDKNLNVYKNSNFDKDLNYVNKDLNTENNTSIKNNVNLKQNNYKECEIENRQRLFIENPLLWSTNEPNLYELETELYLFDASKENLILCESFKQKIGFKDVVFDHDKGLILNGKRMKINGVCEHHDLGALGAAFNKCAMRRRMEILKEMGVNGIRTAHNMPAPELMDLADEMGFLVLSESFDMWERPKTNYDYARFFDDNYRKDVKSWVMRDRNHPSLLMWSIGNEIYDTHADKRGEEITKMLMDEVHKYDPCENGKVTLCSNYMPWENTQKCADILKMAGYNYGEVYYDKQHEEHDDWITFGSETASVVQSRGIYHFPYEKPILAEDDEQCSDLGNSSTSWGADCPEYCIKADRDREYSLGQFIWTGFDYIGEPTPYHTKNSYFGQIDTAGFKKDSFYIYQAEWTDYRKEPMVHIFPYWDFNKGQMIDVRICSNAPIVELYINGKYIGVHHIDHKYGENLVPTFKVPYEEGEIKAVAYDTEGNVLCEDVKKSFKDACKICVKSDKDMIKSDGRDLIFVDISMEDENGNHVYNANNRVNVKVTGAGRLLGLDNGDSTDYDEYKGTSRRLFSGRLLAIIGSNFESGEIKVEVSSKGMDTVVKTFEAVDVDNTEGVSALQYNKETKIVLGNADEIPVRKIEISSCDGQEFNEDKREIIVDAKIYPLNSTYDDIKWSIVSDGGIPTNIAEVKSIVEEVKSIESSAETDKLGQVLQSKNIDNRNINNIDNSDINNKDNSNNKNNNNINNENMSKIHKAKITELGGGNFILNRAKITALGDGNFRLRCTSNNGSDKVRVISELEFKVDGLGAAYKDPYNFICAGLYDYGKGEIGNGNEKGVSTMRDGTTVVGFHNIDFGAYGSDTITIPIFALNNDKYSLQIYEGMPDDEDSILLADTFYQKESIWNVYQEETYKLSKRLKGITSISFVLHAKVHIKGFYFEKKNRAYEMNYAYESDNIYGDTFEVKDKFVEGIGNNVSLVFDNMDFGDDGTTKVQICGKSPIDKNSITILCENKDGSQFKQLIEFTHTENYEEKTFELEIIKGIQTVVFVFLPGCNFNFGYFKFLK